MGILNNSNVVGSSGDIGLTGTTGTTSSTISIPNLGTGLTYATSGFFSIQPQKTKYHVLGTDIEVDGYKDPTTALYVSMINIMGRPFYDEVKKQGIIFHREIEDFLSKALITWERERKIETIFDDKGSN